MKAQEKEKKEPRPSRKSTSFGDRSISPLPLPSEAPPLTLWPHSVLVSLTFVSSMSVRPFFGGGMMRTKYSVLPWGGGMWPRIVGVISDRHWAAGTYAWPRQLSGGRRQSLFCLWMRNSRGSQSLSDRTRIKPCPTPPQNALSSELRVEGPPTPTPWVRGRGLKAPCTSVPGATWARLPYDIREILGGKAPFQSGRRCTALSIPSLSPPEWEGISKTSSRLCYRNVRTHWTVVWHSADLFGNTLLC